MGSNIRSYFIGFENGSDRNPYYYFCVLNTYYDAEKKKICGRYNAEDKEYSATRIFFLDEKEANAYTIELNAELRTFTGNSITELYECAVHNFLMSYGKPHRTLPELFEELKRISPNIKWETWRDFDACQQDEEIWADSDQSPCRYCNTRNPNYTFGIAGLTTCFFHTLESLRTEETIAELAAIGLVP